MKSHVLSSASLRLKVLPPRSGSPDFSDSMEKSEVESPLIEKKSPLATWVADATDLFILLCSFSLITISIVFVALVFYTQANASSSAPVPLSILQRVISSLSLTVTSAVMMVLGKRYVLFKLANGGLRSRRVAVYCNPSIGNLASYLLLHHAELPLLSLSAVWGLALATGLTVNDSWEVGPHSDFMDITVPVGPLDLATSNSSWIVSASEQLAFVVSSACFGVASTVGLINITSAKIRTDYPMGHVYYPPLPYSQPNIGFSFPTMMNGFNISLDPLSSVPSTAQNLTCVPDAVGDSLNLWSDASDNQTLSIIVVDSSNFISNTIYRFNATAIIMGGTLSSSGNYTEFALNGTSRPNVMNGNQWVQDITNLICNTTFPPVGACHGSSLSDFARYLNANVEVYGDPSYTFWSTILNTALGAYSSAVYPNPGNGLQIPIPITQYGAYFQAQYGIYVLILNIIVSIAMLFVVVRLRLASYLGPDFLNSTRLLLDPLKNPELFNASLDTTVDVLGDPYILVGKDSELLVAEGKTMQKGKR